MFHKNVWGILCSLVLLPASLVSEERFSFVAAPASAYPSFSSVPIREYDSATVQSIVKLINPPNLILKRVPARLLQSAQLIQRRGKSIPDSSFSSRSAFKDLPHFDTPTFIEYTESLPSQNFQYRESTVAHNTDAGKNNSPLVNLTLPQFTQSTVLDSNIAKSTTRIQQQLARQASGSNKPPIKKTPSYKEIPLPISGSRLSPPREELTISDILDPQLPEANTSYRFNYSVQDHVHRDVKSHSEIREGDVVTGEYSILEPDGYTRKVTYYSDSASGFKARVLRIAPVKTNLI